MPGAIVIGAGPGIGSAVARRLAREGLSVGVLARSQATVEAALGALAADGAEAYGATADAADEHALRAGLDALVARVGVPAVLVYNAALIRGDEPGELSVAEHQAAWAVNVVGAITAAAHLLPRMAEAGGGSYLITGGMPRPVPQVTSLSLGKAGVRALVRLLDAQYGPAGIHVATVTVGGTVAPGSAFDPDEIAGEYWRLHAQPAGTWEREVPYAGRPPAALNLAARVGAP
jgi:NAD(P)-dependent dehydrogenase (short-subunit alcohol dehydrogenase family)